MVKEIIRDRVLEVLREVAKRVVVSLSQAKRVSQSLD
jgi:hypothetical protein